MDNKPKLGAMAPFLALAGILGIIFGYLFSSSIDLGSVRAKEVPFGPDPGSSTARGRNFGGLEELDALPNSDQVKFHEAAKLLMSFHSQPALNIFTSLRQKHPAFFLADGAIALVHVGGMDTSKSDSISASKAIHSGLAKDTDHPWLNYVAGRFWDKAHRTDSALVYYRKSIQAAPHFAYPYIRLGRIQMEKNELGLARASYRTAIGLMASSPSAYTLGKKLAVPATEVPPYDYLATLFFQTGAEDSAVMALEYSQEKGWKTNQMDLVQGWLWEAHGFLQKADSTYHRLVKREPHNPEFAEALTTLGWKPTSRRGNTRPSDAEAIFAISLLDPLARQHTQNAPLWMALGQAYYRRGLFGLATECFDSSLQYDPGSPSLNEKRDAAYNALIHQSSGSSTDGEGKGRARPALAPGEEQAAVTIPGSIALLGTYSVPWGSSQTSVRQAYPKKQFQNLPGGNLMDTFVLDGLTHEYLLAFKDGKLWGVRVYITDVGGNTGDVFGRMIRTKVKISGEGRSTGEASCPSVRSFQGLIWENDDTFEFMAQFANQPNQVRLARVALENLPKNRRLCDLVEYLKDAAWQ